MNVERAILMADVSGSTLLYERHGDEEASRRVFQCVERMQRIATENGGEFVRSKGDDVLCLFSNPDIAVATARDILSQNEADTVSVHAGIHWGQVLWRGEELFGGALNIAARLSSHAKSNEALISSDLTDRLSPVQSMDLRHMGEIALRGTVEPTLVSSLMIENFGDMTFISVPPRRGGSVPAKPEKTILGYLNFPGWSHSLCEGDEIKIGRSLECDLVLSEPWISRVHATVTVRGGLVEFADRSAGGCSLSFGMDNSHFIRRQTVNLNGEGKIELSGATEGVALPTIAFKVL